MGSKMLMYNERSLGINIKMWIGRADETERGEREQMWRKGERERESRKIIRNVDCRKRRIRKKRMIIGIRKRRRRRRKKERKKKKRMVKELRKTNG